MIKQAIKNISKMMARVGITFGLLFLGLLSFAQDYQYFSPTDFEIDKSTTQIIIVGKTAKEVRIYNGTNYNFIKSYLTQLPPKAVAVTKENILVATSYSTGELLILGKKRLKLKKKIKVGHGACDVVCNKDFSRAFVANEFSNDISVVDLNKGIEISRIPVLRQPKKIQISQNNKYLFVANFLPAGAADKDTVASSVSIIDVEKQTVIKNLLLANGSNALRGISLSYDGNYVFVSHNLGRFQVPTTQLEQGWMNTSALSIIDTKKLEYVATVLLDDPEFGAAGSWGIDCNEKNIVVAHSGTHDFSVINYRGFIEKLSATSEKEKLSYNLRFLNGIRTRIKVVGNGPREIKLVEDKVFIANYYSDSINILNLKDPEKGFEHISLSENLRFDEVRLGEIYFNDATYCFQGWQSCNGCHPGEARNDGLNWDLLNDGIGNPKNCKSMLYAHVTAPAMITGIRPDAETAVRAGFKHIQFTQISEKHAVAVDQYLKSLQPVPSPYLINGQLSEKAKAGKKVFESVGCGHCHSGKYFTDFKRHEMGKQGKYDRQNSWDTPTLVETWRTAPYLHDGRSATMMDVFRVEKHGLHQNLSQKEMEALVEYVLSL